MILAESFDISNQPLTVISEGDSRLLMSAPCSVLVVPVQRMQHLSPRK